MIEVDRVMIDELHITLIQMMENAGRNLARLALDRYAPTTAAVLAGTGGSALSPRSSHHTNLRAYENRADYVGRGGQIWPYPPHSLRYLTPIINVSGNSRCRWALTAETSANALWLRTWVATMT